MIRIAASVVSLGVGAADTVLKPHTTTLQWTKAVNGIESLRVTPN